jgi:hypothetical protein
MIISEPANDRARDAAYQRPRLCAARVKTGAEVAADASAAPRERAIRALQRTARARFNARSSSLRGSPAFMSGRQVLGARRPASLAGAVSTLTLRQYTLIVTDTDLHTDLGATLLKLVPAYSGSRGVRFSLAHKAR